MQDFRQLEVWQRAHGLVLACYQASATLPSSESFGLQLNLRRSAVSVARSIAEGTGQGSDAEFAVHLRKARAAGHDLEYVILLCRDLGFFEEPLYERLLKETLEVRKMISGLLRRMNPQL